MKKIYFLFAIIATVAFTSCSKEGKQGVAGKDGNANVISSNTVTLTNWIAVLDDGINYNYTSTISYASITDQVKNKGVVMVYAQSGSDWYALPYSDAGNEGGIIYSTSTNYSINTGSIKIEDTGFDGAGTSYIATSLNGMVIRIVVIPASITSKYPNTNWKDYKEVDKLVNTYRAE